MEEFQLFKGDERLSPELAAKILSMAMDMFESGDAAAAALLLEDLRLVFPDIDNYPAINVLRAKIAFHYGKQSLALEILRRGICLVPSDARMLECMGSLLVKSGDLVGAGRYLLKSQRIRRYENKQDTYVYGDSHAFNYFAHVPRCRVVKSDHMTMHRIGRDGLRVLDFAGIPNGRNAVVCFGEIDVRVHVFASRDGDCRGVSDIINDLCVGYINTILQNKRNYSWVNIIVCSVTPPKNYCDELSGIISGHISDRVDATKAINKYLEAVCPVYGLMYIDLYKYLSDDNGILVAEYSDGQHHMHFSFSEIVEYELEKVLSVQKR